MFDYYLFDLDNCLLYIPRPSEYFDNILLESIKKLSSPEEDLPTRDERNEFWKSGEEYINLLKIWGVPNPDIFWKQFDEVDHDYRNLLVKKKEIHLFNDVLGVLKELQDDDKKVAIVSNTADYIVDFILKEFKITEYFHACFGLGFDKDQAMAKPSPAGILSVLEKLSFNPKKSKALMVGDSIVDVYAAKRASIHACLIRRDLNKYPGGYNDWEYEPDSVFEKLSEIFKL